MSSGLNDRIADFLDTAQAHLDRYVADRDPEDLHQMRLSLKRARALAWILDQAAGDKRFRKGLKPWIRLYRRSGEVRDLEVQLKLLLLLEAPPPIIARWEAMLSCARDNFLDTACRGGESLGQCTAKMRSRSGHLGATPAMAVVRRLWSAAIRDLDPVVSPHWHDNRKRIKRLVYLDRLLPGMFHLLPFLPYSIGLRMDELQDIIGKWHDVLIILEKFKRNQMTGTESAFVAHTLEPRLALLVERVQWEISAWSALAGPYRP